MSDGNVERGGRPAGWGQMRQPRWRQAAVARAAAATVVALALSDPAMGVFVNWEIPHVHPVAVSPDATRLYVCNTPDNRLEVYSITSGVPVPRRSVYVGVRPVSVRCRNNGDVWVVDHVGDCIAIVDPTTLRVRATLNTQDEPADVVFAGSPPRAFVTCSQVNKVLVYDPNDLTAAPAEVAIKGEDPRAMAVSADGGEVYVAIFESGNGSTSLGGGSAGPSVISFPPNVVSDANTPYAGVNPPGNVDPNNPSLFDPAINPNLPTPPAVGLIVKKDPNGAWRDDNGVDWTRWVSGPDAAASGRQTGWDLPDRDLAIINANTLSVSYEKRLMNLCMSLAVNPATGEVTVVGTDATNEVRFEPVLRGKFTRVKLARVNPGALGSATISDLNPHLTYATSTIGQSERDRSLGDPRGIVWNSAGDRGYVAGMGSNNVIVIDAAGARAGVEQIDVGEGPTGLALDESRGRLYVLNKFSSTISVIDAPNETVTATVPLLDPTSALIKVGRKHLYDTHKNSGLGQIACASCHVDGRFDALAWDLGDPTIEMKPLGQNNCLTGLDGGCQPWHPMKGPMTTQTLQDIVGKEPHHWRGDRIGLEEFNPAFQTLQGDDASLTIAEMQEYEDFLSTMHFPPNPYRNFDNTLPTNLALPGHFATGKFALPAGTPLPNGNATAALTNYRTGNLDGPFNCVTCHTLPTGMGTSLRFNGSVFVPDTPDPNFGSLHHATTSVDGSTNITIKVPQLRNVYEKVGFDTTQLDNTRGFGLLHDGSVDSIARFLSEAAFSFANDQEIADMVAFILAFAGSDLPVGGTTDPGELRGPDSQDTHAAVGLQMTIGDANNPPVIQRITDTVTVNDLVNLADSGAVDLVVKGPKDGLNRGWVYDANIGAFQSDRAGETIAPAALLALAAPGNELTYTVVPAGTGVREGIDRDEDGRFDRDELTADRDFDGDVDFFDAAAFASSMSSVPDPNDPAFEAGDVNQDGIHNFFDTLDFVTLFHGGNLP